VGKRPNGEIRYQDDLKQILQVYDPNANTITISSGTPDSLAAMGDSAMNFHESILKLFEDADKKVIQQERGRYKGKEVNIFKLSGFWGGMDMEIVLNVDVKRNILLFLNQKAFDKNGNLSMEANGYLDYPETGPNTIYDVGVPTSAKIIHPEKETEKTAFDKAFEEAVAVIDSSENWPEPRDLVIAYWNKRNAKDYDELAIFWPGSVTWNRRIIEKEKAIEYVFGEVQETNIQGRLIVPYASKGYFDTYGKYNLKMRLSNEKSSKGRYYIISGN
jgi:hypothetical protein